MLLISHRGNIDKICLKRENSQSYIDEAIDKNYYVEIDLRIIDNKLMLGHDYGQYETDLQWLLIRKNKLFIHCKNIEALKFCIDNKLICFYHTIENHVSVINTNLLWTHNLDEITDISIIPLLSSQDLTFLDLNKNIKVAGVCSDFIGLIK
jgi:hypothetical protein